MNGRQFAEAARTVHPDLKVLFVAGYADTAFQEGPLESDMEVLTKRYSLDAFAARVHRLLGS